MSDEHSPATDVKAAWQGQPTEIPPMVLEQVRTDALRLQRRNRFVLIRELIATAVVIVIFGLYLRFLPGALIKAGSALVIGWALVMIWRLVRLLSPRRVPDEALACLDFHRAELERQRDALHRAGRWVFLPMAVVFVLFGVGRWIGPTPPGRALWVDHLIIAVISALLAETLVLARLWQLNRADKLQDRIDELDAQGSRAP